MFRFIAIIIALCLAIDNDCCACTSMVVSARKTSTGRPLLWKHRDTDAENNFIAKVEATDSTLAYIGLFNEGDSLLREAWMGMNEKGFAVMNTASYNLPDYTTELKDAEGLLMARALKQCVDIDDFESLLKSRPIGIRANFGVIDSNGGAAYFEASDLGWVRYEANDAPEGYLIRTNYSMSGPDGVGRGYIRYQTAQKLTNEHKGLFAPEDFTEGLSRQFYHSLIGRDLSNDSIIFNMDFIPRPISKASLVISSDSTGEMFMWGCLGYPPCGVSQRATLDFIPEDFLPDSEWKSKACEESDGHFRQAVPTNVGGDNLYIDMNRLRPFIEDAINRSNSNLK